MGASALFGFPTTYILANEIANSVGENDAEKNYLRSHLQPHMVIAGIVTLQVGTAVNIIAGQATMSMNARSYDMESREITKRKLYDIAEGMEKITDCKFDLEYVDGYEPIINDPGIVDLVISACRKNMGEDSVKIGEYDEGSDDFSYYMNATGTSGAYFFLLSGHEREECFVNHHPRFTWKEEAMKIGVESYLSVLMEYLN